jgi:hypothetical protein
MNELAGKFFILCSDHRQQHFELLPRLDRMRLIRRQDDCVTSFQLIGFTRDNDFRFAFYHMDKRIEWSSVLAQFLACIKGE